MNERRQAELDGGRSETGAAEGGTISGQRPMSFRDRLWLRVTVGWTLFVWLVFTRNIVGDPKHSFGFKAVHVTLAIISIVLAIGVWVVSSRGRSRDREEVRN